MTADPRYFDRRCYGGDSYEIISSGRVWNNSVFLERAQFY